MLLTLLTASAAHTDHPGQTDTIERAICADATLAAKEVQMQDLYATALKNLPPPQRAAQTARQAEWLRARAGCSADPRPQVCIADPLGRRLVELKIVLARTPLVAATTYRCLGSDPTEVHATYYRSEPPAVRLKFLGHDLIAFEAPSGSGARYTADGLEIWEHQGIARFTWAGVQRNCPKE